jgi:hypothetical protein
MKDINFQELVLSRRRFGAVLALWPTTLVAKDYADGTLMSLGQTFERLAREVDSAIADECEMCEVTLRTLGEIADTIAATPARTSAGLRVKARAACWALLGDLEGPAQGTIDQTMARSIVRDLIRNCDPQCEDAGAMKRLILSATVALPIGSQARRKEMSGALAPLMA